MMHFLYTAGSMLVVVLLSWLGMFIVLLGFDALASKARKLCRESVAVLLGISGAFTVLAYAGDMLAFYIIAPAVGAGYSFFFAG